MKAFVEKPFQRGLKYNRIKKRHKVQNLNYLSAAISC